MDSRLRDAIAPSYLFLCLVLGGSAQGIWANMTLQLLGLAIVTFAIWDPAREPLGRPATNLLIIAALGAALVALQMVPLPPSLWQRLGGRSQIVEGFGVLGLSPGWLPLSLAPYRSFDTLLGLIPPLALYTAIARLRAFRPSWLAAALLLGTICGVVLGTLQVTGGGQGGPSDWYLYEESSYGLAVGFFANANHMADLLACTLPFVAALLAAARGANRDSHAAIIVGVIAAAVLILVGIVLNHSLAVYGLTPPVLAASALLLLPRRRWRRWTMLAVAALTVAALALLATNSARSGALGGDTATAVGSRHEMLVTSGRAIGDFMPWGSGLGTFRSVYQLYENPTQVTNTYVIHAHNDYVELALETGLPGILLMIAFLAWWVRAVSKVWRRADSGVWTRAASIASTVILIHSLVDFPLRTAAISAVFGMCLALLTERRTVAVAAKGDLRPTRHVVVG